MVLIIWIKYMMAKTQFLCLFWQIRSSHKLLILIILMIDLWVPNLILRDSVRYTIKYSVLTNSKTSHQFFSLSLLLQADFTGTVSVYEVRLVNNWFRMHLGECRLILNAVCRFDVPSIEWSKRVPGLKNLVLLYPVWYFRCDSGLLVLRSKNQMPFLHSIFLTLNIKFYDKINK